VSAGEPYQGNVNSQILFDGSKSHDSDGNITKWTWTFGDNTNGTGKTVRHAYTKPGTYTVTLTVTDDRNKTNTDTTTCMITQPNRPPTEPIITGPTNGTKNMTYNYTVKSTDPDNDTIQYSFDWGDPLAAPQSSGFLPNESAFTLNHSWTAAGRYTITVTANDSQNMSSSETTVYINTKPITDIGYLIDNDSDGIYDAFYSDVSKKVTAVQVKNGNYSIDVDGNGIWDYTFNVVNGQTSSYQVQDKTPGFEFVFVIGAIALLMVLKRKRK
jgi:PKD repeat protein